MEKRIIQISAGRGPAECAWVVAQLLKVFLSATREQNFKVEELSREKGPENGTLNSVSLYLQGFELAEFMDEWKGTIQWIGKSPYRKFHKRKNWFVGIDVFELSGKNHFNPKDLKFDTFRSSGSGGQHVNKVETAVRAIHIPTGISAVASATPSQSMNKKLAIEKLKIELEKHNTEQAATLATTKWSAHNSLERGNPARIYEGKKFVRKK